MKCLRIISADLPIQYQDIPSSDKTDEQVWVELKASSLNHRDLWITQGKYANIVYPCILGSDGAGVYNGSEVILQPGFNWGDNPAFQGAQYQMLGLPQNGTFAQSVAVNNGLIHPKPGFLSWEEAAALPLAGLTAFRAAIGKCKITKKDKVLISGIGGGVALFAFQFALATGAEVWVSSGSPEKIQKAKNLGAAEGFLYSETNWGRSQYKKHGGFDVIIDSAAGPGFSEIIQAAAFGSRIAIYGGTHGNIDHVSPQILFWRQITLFGTTMGTDKEFKAMLDFVSEKRIHPIIDSVFPLSEGQKAFERMKTGEQFGKIVLDNNR